MQTSPRILPDLKRLLESTAIVLMAGLVTTLAACGGLPPSVDRIAPPAVSPKVDTQEVMFIHGMFVTPSCWDLWRPVFEQAGYTVSAPAWPLHDVPINRTKDAARMEALGRLGLEQVLDRYRALLKAKPVKPILVGHSMGGLIAQKLLGEGLAQAAIAIDSAPPKGVFIVKWSFLKANWPVINPFADVHQPVVMSKEGFAYAFANQQRDGLIDAAFPSQIIPESRKIAKDTLTDAGAIELSKPRGPLLMIAGEKDHIIPAALNYKNFEIYRNTQGLTEFRVFEGRDHWLIAGAGWEEIAGAVLKWIKAQQGQ